MLEVKNIDKTYRPKKGSPVHALDNVSVSFADKGLVFILGKSGCGKSTLLNVIGGLDKFDSGEIIIKGKSSNEFKRSDFDSYRNTFIGFIFQEYNLLNEFTIEKNIALALELQGKKATKENVLEILTQVGLEKEGKRKTTELSGGQKQRVAIARALIKEPEIIIADEPTGALDSNTGRQVFETLKKLGREKLVIVVSHDRDYAEEYGDRVIEMKDGKIISDDTKRYIPPKELADGFNIIGNDIIHIEKGHTVTDKEVEAVSSFLKKFNGNDVIISINEKNNKEFKRISKIDDSGNSERFNATTGEDIVTKAYNKRDLKLIKSRLKAKDSFKIGVGALKTKPVRLMFTIFLSLVAFTIFGMTQTMSAFSKGSAVYDLVKDSGVNQIVLTKTYNMNMMSIDDVISKKDLANLKTKFPNYSFYSVVASGSYIDEINYGSYSDILYSNRISGIMPIPTESELSVWNLKKIAGNLPVDVSAESTPEIAISKQIFESAKKNGTNIYNEVKTYYTSEEDKPTNYDWQSSDEGGNYVIKREEITINNYTDFIGQEISMNVNNRRQTFKIVAIIDPNIDLTEYSNLSDSELSDKSDELEILTEYSTLNMCYVSTGFYNANYADGFVKSNGDMRYMSSTSTEEYPNTISDSSLGTTEYLETLNERMSYSPFGGAVQITNIINYITSEGGANGYLKSGVTSIGDNEIVLQKSEVKSLFDLKDDEIKSSIDNGLKVTLTKAYGLIKVLEMDVIGYVDSNGEMNNQIVSNKTKQDLIELNKGYSYIMASLTGNENNDRNLIVSLETADSNGATYAVTNRYSSLFIMIDGIILTFTKILIYVAIGFAVFSALMLMNYIATSIANKKREIGVLRAIGARGTDVFKIFFSEALVISLINFALSAIAVFVASYFINDSISKEIGFTLKFMRPGVIVLATMLGISIGTAIISSFLPVNSIAKKQPIDAINNR